MPAPVTLIAGDDDLLLHRELERVLGELTSADAELQVETHDVQETAHLPELRTASLFGGRVCLVLRGVEAIAGDLKAELEDYLADPSDEAVVVLVARGTGKAQKIAKLAKEHGERIDVKAPADWDDGGWDRLVGEEFRRLARKADTSAIRALRAHAGADPSVIASKVGQVVAGSPADVVLTAEHVEAAVEGHGRQSGFAVADAVADRDAAGALVALRGALEAGEAPLALLGAIVFRFRQLLVVRGGGGPKDAGMSPGQHRRLKGIASRFHPGELAWCHDRLAQTDVDLKGSDLGAELVLELAVLEVAMPREVGAPWNPLAAR
ncbi:MAG: DNA polymerase III subunit delta [Actinobacteria bacterium]|nr:DNA polymerase III subunit delta [Actinomycetota bacterium]